MIDTGAPPEDILPDNLTYNNNRFIRVKPIEDVSNVIRINYAKLIDSLGTQPDTMSYFRNMMKQYKGQTIKLVKRYSLIDYKSDIDMDEMEKLIKEGKKTTYAVKKRVKFKPLKMESAINKNVKINGKWYKEGDRVRQYTIVKVSSGEALLKSKKKELKLFQNQKNDKIQFNVN